MNRLKCLGVPFIFIFENSFSFIRMVCGWYRVIGSIVSIFVLDVYYKWQYDMSVECKIHARIMLLVVYFCAKKS